MSVPRPETAQEWQEVAEAWIAFGMAMAMMEPDNVEPVVEQLATENQRVADLVTHGLVTMTNVIDRAVCGGNDPHKILREEAPDA